MFPADWSGLFCWGHGQTSLLKHPLHRLFFVTFCASHTFLNSICEPLLRGHYYCQDMRTEDVPNPLTEGQKQIHLTEGRFYLDRSRRGWIISPPFPFTQTDSNLNSKDGVFTYYSLAPSGFLPAWHTRNSNGFLGPIEKKHEAEGEGSLQRKKKKRHGVNQGKNFHSKCAREAIRPEHAIVINNCSTLDSSLKEYATRVPEISGLLMWEMR